MGSRGDLDAVAWKEVLDPEPLLQCIASHFTDSSSSSFKAIHGLFRFRILTLNFMNLFGYW
jgi:hypothetical protein